MTERSLRADARWVAHWLGLLLWFAITASLLYSGYTGDDLAHLILGVGLVIMQQQRHAVRQHCGGDETGE